MTGMRTKGIHHRAVEVRAAANRLRWEIDLALGTWPKTHTPNVNDYVDATSAIDEIAETVAILRKTLDIISEQVPKEQQKGGIFFENLKERLASKIEYYLQYHQVGR